MLYRICSEARDSREREEDSRTLVSQAEESGSRARVLTVTRDVRYSIIQIRAMVSSWRTFL